MIVRKAVQAERQRLQDPRDPDYLTYPTRELHVLTASETIDKLQTELDDKREQTTMKLVNDMTQYVSKEDRDKEE